MFEWYRAGEPIEALMADCAATTAAGGGSGGNAAAALARP